MIRIAGTEGLPGLYKGFAPSLFLVSHGAIQFTAYERLKKAVSDARKGTGENAGSVIGAGEPTAFECAWLGVASKLIASVATYPSQVVRSRMQQRGNAGAQGGGSEEVRRRAVQRDGAQRAEDAAVQRGDVHGVREHAVVPVPRARGGLIMFFQGAAVGAK